MAFEALPGVKIISHANEKTYIISDFFSVYSKEQALPRIYSWSEIVSIAEGRFDFTIATVEDTYKIAKTEIVDVNKLLQIRALLEGAVAAHPKILYSHQRRILPPKTIYRHCDVSANCYSATGVYNEREISYSNVILLNTRLSRVFWIISALTILGVFLILYLAVGDIAANWLYYIPISAFSGLAVTMFFYIACAIIAKYIYAALLKVDPALMQEITFILCNEGFAAIESKVNTNSDLIRWSEAAYFIETNYVYIIFKNKKAVFWLPKRLFPKEKHKELSNFIASRLQQK